jgi:7,8-dihydropterin-6-yl-methyl-4-(beta-D-ribofuranosyl)aminobenzene 5'-phosphate synthase
MAVITITWLVNDVAGPGVRAEHGIAFWIETPGGHVLLDTGGSSKVLLRNMESLELAPAAVDALVLSHAHDDHTGGLAGLLPVLRPGTPLYAHPTLFRQRYSFSTGALVRRGMRVGAEALGARLTLCLDAAPQEVLPGVWTTGEIVERPEAEGRSQHHFVEEGGAKVPDPYQDDLSLVLFVQGGVFLLCGCCHAGLLNTIQHVQRIWEQPLVGIGGGVHLKGASEETLQRTIDFLVAMDALRHAWLGHCSGEAFMQRAAQALPRGCYRQGVAGEQLVVEET